jgi:hypothetical protein
MAALRASTWPAIGCQQQLPAACAAKTLTAKAIMIAAAWLFLTSTRIKPAATCISQVRRPCDEGGLRNW